MEKKKVKFNYKLDKDHKIFYATDVYGQFNPRGNLVMRFFTDMNSIPKESTFKLKKDSTIDSNKEEVLKYLDDEKEDKENISMDRVIHDTLILSPQSAMDVSLWILEKIVNQPRIKFNKEELKKKVSKILNVKKDLKK